MTATERKFAPTELAVEADGTFAGYASLFGKADLGRDVVLPGAFACVAEAARGGGRQDALPARPRRRRSASGRRSARMGAGSSSAGG